METFLLVTDIHFYEARRGYLNHQIETICKIYDEARPDNVIIMGDIFMNRRPKPSVLLGFKQVLDYMSCPVFLLRGNHDSQTKADDGVTALSLYESDRIHVITHTENIGDKTFIPHYENEEIISDALARVPKNNIVFGHFGYDTCLDTFGFYPSDIGVGEFCNPTYLGHIHRYSAQGNVTILGTQYTTNYGEAGKENFYGILKGDKITLHEPEFGIRHLVYNLEDLEEHASEINDPNYFTLLRVMVNKLDESNQSNLASEILETYNIQEVDIKFKPIMTKGETLSDFSLSRDIFTLNEGIISSYIEASNSTIPVEDLWEGYNLLSNEN